MTTQEALTALTAGFAKANLNADAIQEKLMQIRGFIAANKAFGNFSVAQMQELLPMLEAHYAPAPAPTVAEMAAAQRPVVQAPPIISSQRYLHESLVAEKAETLDEFTVTLSPPFSWDGEMYQTILNGHHAMAAALSLGTKPSYRIATTQECGEVEMLAAGDIEGFLEATRCDCSWYDVETGYDIF